MLASCCNVLDYLLTLVADLFSLLRQFKPNTTDCHGERDLAELTYPSADSFTS